MFYALKYLDTIISINGRWEEEIVNKISKVIVIRVCKTIYSPFFDKKDITNKTKTRIYEWVLVPMLTMEEWEWIMASDQQFITKNNGVQDENIKENCGSEQTRQNNKNEIKVIDVNRKKLNNKP